MLIVISFRKNGQLLNAGMAVVIQQMVPSDVSGVIFTTDPVTGSYGYITVTANYGLGEVFRYIQTSETIYISYKNIIKSWIIFFNQSVVSGASEPDTIVIRRSWDDHLKVIKTDIGKKNVKIILKSNYSFKNKQLVCTYYLHSHTRTHHAEKFRSEIWMWYIKYRKLILIFCAKDDGGTEEQTTDLKEASKCSLKDKKALKLAKVAVYLENSYGTPRDIEWAMHKKKIYLLQVEKTSYILNPLVHIIFVRFM